MQIAAIVIVILYATGCLQLIKDIVGVLGRDGRLKRKLGVVKDPRRTEGWNL